MPLPEEHKIIFHVDMDAFYASVEQVDNPEYQGRPVIVGASPGKRGVVSACSYEAREFGVHSAMPISQAFELCKKGIFVHVRMRRYQEISRTIMSIFDRFTPVKTQISIDEAFLDMTGTEKLFGSPHNAARQIKAAIYNETGLTISVGIAPNRLLAKIASDFDKPDGLTEIKNGEELAFLDKIRLKDIWGLGKKTLGHLQDFNITTVQQLRQVDLAILKKIAGTSGGQFLFNAARGIDPGIYTGETKSRSISSETTFSMDTRNIEEIKLTLLNLSDQIMFRLMEHGYKSKTVFIKIRYSDFRTISVQKTLDRYLRTSDEIYKTALRLFEKKWDKNSSLRLVGLGASSIEEKDFPDQIQLFSDSDDQRSKVEKAVLSLRTKGTRITKASLMGKS